MRFSLHSRWSTFSINRQSNTVDGLNYVFFLNFFSHMFQCSTPRSGRNDEKEERNEERKRKRKKTC